MGVTRSTAEQIVAEYAIDRIERAIAYTQDKQQEGGVKNTAAFVVTAIKKDFNDALAEEKRKKAEAVGLQKQQEKLKKQWQTIKTGYSDWKMQTVRRQINWIKQHDRLYPGLGETRQQKSRPVLPGAVLT